MPEGPSIVILKEALTQFKGKTILAAEGNSQALDLNLLLNKTVIDFKSWGKHFLICFEGFSLRIHFMLFGTYRINERKTNPARLSLIFEDGEINFYACSIKVIEEDLDEVYDWSADVLSIHWDPAKAIEKLKSQPKLLVCDALLDQNIFAGSGNIIKNEVLFRIQVHPLNTIGALPQQALEALVFEAANYSYDFLRWKKEFTLKQHWLAHTKKTCPRDDVPFIKEYLGRTNRRTYYCNLCQRLFA
ncbi:DNA-formamidopyrimidine glycosylase family protein [Desertivirga xinjiangensis]|uniref:DNA-formamidopyrimidine glycosylase family protein n=1 Tax=Desertivirga xinjiangensis TaxID=539206 RepID=UPI00210A947F|nr:DNA-formamidopyrimidine glycosylase family protein [Pedobacter xinjiangensis]